MTRDGERIRNDPGQYDELADQWWEPRGDFAMLAWIAEARAGLVPAAKVANARLLDVACGGGLLAPHLAGKGYVHVGVDLSAPATRLAQDHGVAAVRGDVRRLPFADATFDVVVAGEILEHVHEHSMLMSEACRVLQPGGTLVIDTIASTAWARFASITLAERLPAGPPRLLHDGAMFVDRARLVHDAAAGGVTLTLNGLRPSAVDYVRWLVGRRANVRMVKVRSTAALFQGVGIKAAP